MWTIRQHIFTWKPIWQVGNTCSKRRECTGLKGTLGAITPVGGEQRVGAVDVTDLQRLESSIELETGTSLDTCVKGAYSNAGGYAN